jgi:hypothetical protein
MEMEMEMEVAAEVVMTRMMEMVKEAAETVQTGR